MSDSTLAFLEEKLTSSIQEQVPDYFAQKKVLMTGAAGFIGSYLTKALLRLGAQVTAVDNFATSEATNPNLADCFSQPGFTFIQADVTQPPTTYLPEDRQFFDLILHFASPASPPLYQAQPVMTYLVNSIGTHYLAQHLLQTNPAGRLLFAGTSEAYGTPLEHPQRETYWGNVNPNGIRSCYDEAKRLGETICGVHHRDLGLDTRIVRIFNTYGPRMNLADGRILPAFINQVRAGGNPVVYGDGQQTRSYCFITDLVRGILTFAGGESSLAGETINLGNPGEFTVLQTAQLFNQILGRELQAIDFAPLPKDDPTRRQPDISKAQELLKWQPEIDFETGLKWMLQSYDLLPE